MRTRAIYFAQSKTCEHRQKKQVGGLAHRRNRVITESLTLTDIPKQPCKTESLVLCSLSRIAEQHKKSGVVNYNTSFNLPIQGFENHGHPKNMSKRIGVKFPNYPIED